MIEVYLTNLIKCNTGLRSTGKEIKLRVSGHAGYFNKNVDVVCAGVSAIIQTAIVAITKVAKIGQKIKQDKGFLESTIKIQKLDNNSLKDLIVIISSMLVGLEEILKTYPEALKIHIKNE